MKLGGNLKALVRVEGNKRDQLPPPAESRKPGRRNTKQPGVVYVKTNLELPEPLKLEMDRMFLDHKHELGGKNEFMVEAIREAIRKFKESH